MRNPELQLSMDELIVDNFAGGGGASSGIRMGLGRDPDIAINHDVEAIAMHAANHPNTLHFAEDVYDVDPVKVCAGRKVGLAWFSPDCTFHSKARGGKPFRDRNKARRRRGLAWVVVKWAKLVHPRVICLENVEEFADWGPLGDDGMPCPLRKGFTFRRWIKQLQNLGYEVDLRELRASDYGAPTIRKRLFIIARCDGLPIIWPEQTHGQGLLPVRTAADCIDFGLPCPSIFERVRPLAENTMRRIARGIKKFVIDAAEPFIVGLAHGEHKDRPGSRSHGIDEPMRTIPAQGGNHALVTPCIARIGQTGGNGAYVNSVDEPLTTVTTKAEHLLIAPSIVKQNFGSKPCHGVDEPLHTITTQGNKHTLVSAFLAQHNGGFYDEHGGCGNRADAPLSTITHRGTQQQLVLTHFASNLVNMKGTKRSARAVDQPAPTICAGATHVAEVRAFLIKYHANGGQWARPQDPAPTIPTHDSLGLVTVSGEPYLMYDIGMRMLTPRELFRCQGFDNDYRIELEFNGKPLTKTAQVRMCGNSVCPPVAAAIVRAQFQQADARAIA